MGWDASARLLGIIRYRHAGDLDAVLDALARGGIGLLEVTLGTPGALAAVERGRRAGRAIGVGTVSDADQVSAAADAGAAFVVTPGLVPEVIHRGREVGIDVLVGVLTPTEILAACSLGVGVLKLFPASLGGHDYLRALRGPFPEVAFVPTGGVGIDDVTDYLAAGAACVGLGAELVGRAPPVGEAEVARITERAARAVEAAGR